jgi:adenosylcobinamide kinase/adenosylcobinamide-phosphate guanylyltransferase
MLTLITGGVKSGKSRKALELAEQEFLQPKYFLATAECIDDEMRERIRRHREERGGAFRTIEEPVYIDRHCKNNLIVDCITVWIGNILHYRKEEEWERILTSFLEGCEGNTIVVTNETGMGNIPADPESRTYNRLLAHANRLIAREADIVYLMVSGIPLKVK